MESWQIESRRTPDGEWGHMQHHVRDGFRQAGRYTSWETAYSDLLAYLAFIDSDRHDGNWALYHKAEMATALDPDEFDGDPRDNIQTTPNGSQVRFVPWSRPEKLPHTIPGPDGTPFAWGPVVEIHTIGEHVIVEYQDDMSRTSATDYSHHGRIMFHVEGANISCFSLDTALVTAVAYKREGPNGRAANYFDLMTLGTISGD